ncbi:hypothetical protein FE773_06560 [Caminibacter mediatlanticus TB-2]|uniref:Alpha/beta hydrolase n=1 Tax=Caminibacter mediatlanticus TB-2 TaxID=391592 RepID=A0AAI9AID6_9BACT|nr:pimelyl-ACP methyl ester esterase BioV [Caminibacter mediatlanticus]EDM24208.1 hypothetical protein CMTB2_01793 [Caminibacter mediatlanticus TB-2]QCT94856.1 hypothetical protein FE773_06560 [Caminibacter mediatlanticus TB-2]
MKYFSGFCLRNEKILFKEYLEDNEFIVAGFSKGAQEAVDYVINSNHRIDKLQLLSPAFFDYNEKLIEINLKAFKKDKVSYINNFLKKAGIESIDVKDLIKYDCEIDDLMSLFTFDWEKIKEIKNVRIEIFLGEYDKIIALKKAYDFFKNYGEIYFIKKANHFLRS